MAELTYEKWGTRLLCSDEADERLQRFVFDGAKATAEGRGWEILPGPAERVEVSAYDGDPMVAYLWPVARPKDAWDLLDEALAPVVQQAGEDRG